MGILIGLGVLLFFLVGLSQSDWLVVPIEKKDIIVDVSDNEYYLDDMCFDEDDDALQ